MDLIGNVVFGFAVSGVSAATFYALWCYVAVLPASGTDSAMAQTCRRAVTTLLTTHDAIDLERSRILIGELGCNVRNDALARGE